MRKLASLLAVLLLLGTFAFSQNTKKITGQVRDEAGPVAFASVTETNTNNSVISDVNGNFTITITGNQITISAVDHTPQTITVTGNTANVTLVRTGGQLQEVVVTALGQTRSKAKVGYAASTFNSETITRTAPVNPLDALQGKVAGADISHIGGPGASTKVVLRGYGVIAGGTNQPLYVIDGIPLSDARFGASGNTDFGNASGDINPNDIESITVLKGTEASSL